MDIQAVYSLAEPGSREAPPPEEATESGYTARIFRHRLSGHLSLPMTQAVFCPGSEI
jgi:hypothetical protein